MRLVRHPRIIRAVIWNQRDRSRTLGGDCVSVLLFFVRLKLVQLCISLHCLCFSSLMEHQQIQGFPYFANINNCIQCLKMTIIRNVYLLEADCTNRSEKILPVEQL